MSENGTNGPKERLARMADVGLLDVGVCLSLEDTQTPEFLLQEIDKFFIAIERGDAYKIDFRDSNISKQ